MSAEPADINTPALQSLLAAKYPRDRYALFFDVPDNVGTNQHRRADAIAVGCWRSVGHLIEGFELKISRSDWLREVASVAKADPFIERCDRWWLVTSSASIAKPEEIPACWGWMAVTKGGLRVQKPAPPLGARGNQGAGMILYPGTFISECGRYRYTLERHWTTSPRYVLWLMLNPSTADATTNDATIRRCVRYATDWGFGGILVGNLYAYRATQPAELFTVADPVGPQNDTAILDMVARSQMIVCAWGQRGPNPSRRWNVLRDLGVPHHRQVRALKVNDNGEPGHPLRLPLGAQPLEWDPTRQARDAGNGNGA